MKRVTLALLPLAILFTCCATTSLQTQTKTTQTIFLDPVKKSQRSVYLTVKNTSGQKIGDLEQKIDAKLIQKGYKIVDDPDMAKYILMVNVLFANNLKEANAAKAGADGAALGATAGVIGSALSGGNGYNIGSAGLIGAAAGGLLSAGIGKLTEDEIFRMVTDVSVREVKEQKVYTTTNTAQSQASISQNARAGDANSFAGRIGDADGAGGKLNSNQVDNKSQIYDTNYVEHKTRVFSEAVKMNLNLQEAMPVLTENMAEQISGIF
jgi:hypothetical protein